MLSLLRRFNVVLEYSGWLICTGLLLSFSIIAIPQEVLPLPVSTQFNSVTDQNNNENETSLICNGSLTLNTTTTIQWVYPVGNHTTPYTWLPTYTFINTSWLSFVEKRSSTITIPFIVNINYSYASNVYDMLEGDILGWSNCTASWIGNWSITNISGCSKFTYEEYTGAMLHSYECIPTSNNPGSGKVSGSAWGQVSGLYRNGQVFFNFNPYLRSLVFFYPPYSSPGGNQYFENVIDYSRIDGDFIENITAPNTYPYPRVWRYTTQNLGFGYSVYNPIYDGLNALWLASGGISGDGVKRGWMNRTQIKSDLGNSADLEIPFSGEYDFLDDSYYFSHSFGSIDQSLIKGGHIIFEYTGMVKLKVETPTPLANITEISGKVEINAAQGDTWESAVAGSALRIGDRVRTVEDGKAKATFLDGSFFKFFKGLFRVGLKIWDIITGKCFIKWATQYAKYKYYIQVRTVAILATTKGTEFTVEVAEDNATTITVFEGNVDVQDRISGSNITVAANQTLTVHPVPGGLTQQEMSALITTVDPASVDRWWGAPTELFCSVSKNTITQGDGIVVSGSINVSLSGKTVTLTYIKPDESILNRTVTTGSDGSYSDSYNPDAAGTWSVTASWTGDSTHNGATSSTRSLTVNSVTFILFSPLGMALTGGIILLAVIVVLLILRRRPKIPGNTLSFFRVVDTFANYHSFTYSSY
jgi:hypothetical protein